MKRGSEGREGQSQTQKGQNWPCGKQWGLFLPLWIDSYREKGSRMLLPNVLEVKGTEIASYATLTYAGKVNRIREGKKRKYSFLRTGQ